MNLRIVLHPSFFVAMAFLLLLNDTLPWMLLMAVIVHELGHLLALQCLGVEYAELKLSLSGGLLDAPPLEARALALTALAGPAASLLWAGFLIRSAPMAAWLSLAVGIFNLLPIPPLDGGTVLQSFARPRSIALIRILTFGSLISIALMLQPLLGWWPLLLSLWALFRAIVENRLVKRIERE